MAESGAVSYLFDKKGQIFIEEFKDGEDALMEIALDAGADDMVEDDGSFEIFTAQTDFESVRHALQEKNIPIANAEIALVPQTLVKVEGKNAETVLKLMDAIEDLDDVQNVYSNFDIEPSQI